MTTTSLPPSLIATLTGESDEPGLIPGAGRACQMVCVRS